MERSDLRWHVIETINEATRYRQDVLERNFDGHDRAVDFCMMVNPEGNRNLTIVSDSGLQFLEEDDALGEWIEVEVDVDLERVKDEIRKGFSKPRSLTIQHEEDLPF